ncbi:hypothetical protein [Janthinobacterium sp.]|uniref:hypothetical protein n=1 Tax=Janthinobacterium sp. TaxID=1871054 RepID=UPI002590BF9D|nr:hypothetical protein [Janthinobacterium sp.]MCX7289575.1 hypothetical protein [Janthinobacterium sp.]
MSNVPVLGNYVSEDKNFTFKISSADSSNGAISGVYNASYSPVGPLTSEGNIGHYSWVFNKSQGKDGVAPFVISFGGSARPDGRPYCISDAWNGAYQTDNSILAEGVRSFVNQDGVVQVRSLGTLRFAIA